VLLANAQLLAKTQSLEADLARAQLQVRTSRRDCESAVADANDILNAERRAWATERAALTARAEWADAERGRLGEQVYEERCEGIVTRTRVFFCVFVCLSVFFFFFFFFGLFFKRKLKKKKKKKKKTSHTAARAKKDAKKRSSRGRTPEQFEDQGLRELHTQLAQGVTGPEKELLWGEWRARTDPRVLANTASARGSIGPANTSGDSADDTRRYEPASPAADNEYARRVEAELSRGLDESRRLRAERDDALRRAGEAEALAREDIRASRLSASRDGLGRGDDPLAASAVQATARHGGRDGDRPQPRYDVSSDGAGVSGGHNRRRRRHRRSAAAIEGGGEVGGVGQATRVGDGGYEIPVRDSSDGGRERGIGVAAGSSRYTGILEAAQRLEGRARDLSREAVAAEDDVLARRGPGGAVLGRGGINGTTGEGSPRSSFSPRNRHPMDSSMQHLDRGSLSPTPGGSAGSPSSSSRHRSRHDRHHQRERVRVRLPQEDSPSRQYNADDHRMTAISTSPREPRTANVSRDTLRGSTTPRGTGVSGDRARELRERINSMHAAHNVRLSQIQDQQEESLRALQDVSSSSLLKSPPSIGRMPGGDPPPFNMRLRD
jgi:hypothetical protein